MIYSFFHIFISFVDEGVKVKQTQCEALTSLTPRPTRKDKVQYYVFTSPQICQAQHNQDVDIRQSKQNDLNKTLCQDFLWHFLKRGQVKYLPVKLWNMQR